MKDFRYTAIPLITVDPYFSIWSFSDCLYDDSTRNWCGKRNSMTGLLRVDDKWYRFLGKVQSDDRIYFAEPDAIPQKSVKVEATKTIYCFENEIVNVELIFRTPLLCDDLLLMSRPVSYISYNVKFTDGKKHDCFLYFDIGAETCVDNTDDIVSFGKTDFSVFCGKGEKDIFKNAVDMTLIEWGNLHLTAPELEGGMATCFDKRDFVKKDNPMQNRTNPCVEPCIVCRDFPAICVSKEFYETSEISGFLCVAYEDFYSVEYFGEKLKGYWAKDGDSFEDVVKKAVLEYDIIKEKCDEFDINFRENAMRINEKYADILCLVYRQVVAAHKLVEKDGKLLFLSRECGSDGFIATVDVTYPSIPMFLLYNPELIEGMLNPVFEFAEGMYGWDFEFAPHDVGFYPKANGQMYGYEEDDPDYILSRQMPVEECGNMILTIMALCKAKNDFSYAKEHIAILEKWADYLVKVGYDPSSQLCTDDFAGHLAHNCNLACKGILAIGAFGEILERCGRDGTKYINIAKKYAKLWKDNAAADDHYGLTFDKKDTWSIKYNLAMDKLLKLEIFDEDIFKAEVEFYKTKFNEYGIPLDCRSDYTKSDWQMWSTCLTDDKEYRDMVIDRMWKMICEMCERVPFSDWYYTKKPNMRRFQNRSVQGGLFMPLLMD